MIRIVLYFTYAGLLILSGLGCLYYAFRNPTTKEKMTKAMQREMPRNYGNPFLWIFGILCIVLAIIMIFRKLTLK